MPIAVPNGNNNTVAAAVSMPPVCAHNCHRRIPRPTKTSGIDIAKLNAI